MEAGEKELRKAFEENTTRNLKSTIQHVNISRDVVNKMEDRVRGLEDKFVQLDGKINEMRNLLVTIQAQMYGMRKEE